MLVVTKDVTFCQSEIDQKDVVTVLVGSHAEIAWMEVAVQDVLAMDILDDGNHLLGKMQDLI